MRLAKHGDLAAAPTSWTSYLDLFCECVPHVARAMSPASCTNRAPLVFCSPYLAGMSASSLRAKNTRSARGHSNAHVHRRPAHVSRQDVLLPIRHECPNKSHSRFWQRIRAPVKSLRRLWAACRLALRIRRSTHSCIGPSTLGSTPPQPSAYPLRCLHQAKLEELHVQRPRPVVEGLSKRPSCVRSGNR